MKRYSVLLILSGVLTLSHAAHAASSIQSFSPATNDRFANDAAFVGSGFDFSGVGRDGSGKWAVMLTSTVFLSANHFAPSGSLTFYEGNDPAAAPTIAAIATGERIGVTDFYIGRLAAPLPSGIASYSYVTIPLTSGNFGTSPLFNAGIFMGGISPTTAGYGTAIPDVTDYAVGTNRIEGFASNVTADGTGGAVGDILFTVQNLAGDSAFGYSTTTYETQLAGGDSGSPLFLISGGNLVVGGTALGVGSGDIDPGAAVATRNFSAFNYTGNYASQITAYISASPVPEPTLAGLVVLACIPMIARRRRHTIS